MTSKFVKGDVVIVDNIGHEFPYLIMGKYNNNLFLRNYYKHAYRLKHLNPNDTDGYEHSEHLILVSKGFRP
jgi:hypothetical protein